MPVGTSFNCPNCGSTLNASGAEKSVRCSYCGSNVIVPEALLGGNQADEEALTPEYDLFSPRHIDWLVQNGADATVKVDVVKERKGKIYKNNPVFDVMFSGKKASGGKFDAICTINLPRNEVPRPGTKLRVKYKQARDYIDDTADYAIEIGGRFVYMVLDDEEDIF